MIQEPKDTEELEIEYVDGDDDTTTDEWIYEPEEEYE